MVDGPTQVTWCPLCRRGEYCPDNERLMKQNTEINADLLAALKDFIDNETCRHDHHGYCQTHGYLQEGVCHMVRARAAIKRAEGK